MKKLLLIAAVATMLFSLSGIAGAAPGDGYRNGGGGYYGGGCGCGW